MDVNFDHIRDPLVIACTKDGFFPPPWNPTKHPEKTKGWIEFQRCMRNEPEYYLGKFDG